MDETIVSGETSRNLVARSDSYRHLKDIHEGCSIRAMGREGINVASWDRQVEIRHGMNATIASSTDEIGRDIKRQKQMKESFGRHFTQLFRRSRKLERSYPLRDFLVGRPQLSAREVEFCEDLITAVEVEAVLADCPKGKSPVWMVGSMIFTRV